MNPPSKELFLHWYNEAASADLAWLVTTYDKSKKYPQYTLLSSFIARCISGKYGSEGETLNALTWADRALSLLDDKNTLKKSYGGDEDYLASLQACVVLKVRWLSLSDEHFHWYKAKDLAEDILVTGFPSIYIKGNTSKDGIFLGLMLMGVYNRLGEHAKAMELGTKIQSQAQLHNDTATECRASFNWAVATMLLSKQYTLDTKFTEAAAALDSACHVLNTLRNHAEMRALLGVFVDAVAEYGALRKMAAGETFSQETHLFADKWSIETQWGLLDIVEMHSSGPDDALAAVFVRNLEAASTGE